MSHRKGPAHSCDFGDEDKLRQHLLFLVNHILSRLGRQWTALTSVDYWTVLRNIFEVAAGSSYPAEGTAGCVAESLLLASINLHTSHSLALSGTIQSQTPSSGLSILTPTNGGFGLRVFITSIKVFLNKSIS